MTAQEFRYTNYMTLKEWKQFKVNYENYRYNIHKSIKGFLERGNNKSFLLLVDFAFNWEETPEGHVYWWKISNRTEPLNLKSCK